MWQCEDLIILAPSAGAEEPRRRAEELRTQARHLRECAGIVREIGSLLEEITRARPRAREPLKLFRARLPDGLDVLLHAVTKDAARDELLRLYKPRAPWTLSCIGSSS